MKSSFFWTVFSLFCGMLLPAVLPAAPPPKGTRILGLSVGPGEDRDYPRALVAAQAMGVQSVTLSLDWSRLETSPHHYDDTLLTTADGFYPSRHILVDLILRPINTNHTEVPVDLQGKTFDNPAVVARFERLLDEVFARTSHLTLHSLVIGNEVDAFLGTDQVRWAQYGTFYCAVRAYARAERPGLKIGVAATFEGLTGDRSKLLQKLNKESDLLMATYYPLHSDFTVRAPSSPGPDLERLCKLYPGRSIELTEAGYPSSPGCGSTEIKQAAFVHSLFAAWDAHASQVVSITLSWQTDIPPAMATADVHYYGNSTASFSAFLGSLGLRTYAGVGRDKLSSTALREEAHARGW